MTELIPPGRVLDQRTVHQVQLPDPAHVGEQLVAELRGEHRRQALVPGDDVDGVAVEVDEVEAVGQAEHCCLL